MKKTVGRKSRWTVPLILYKLSKTLGQILYPDSMLFMDPDQTKTLLIRSDADPQTLVCVEMGGQPILCPKAKEDCSPPRMSTESPSSETPRSPTQFLRRKILASSTSSPKADRPHSRQGPAT